MSSCGVWVWWKETWEIPQNDGEDDWDTNGIDKHKDERPREAHVERVPRTLHSHVYLCTCNMYENARPNQANPEWSTLPHVLSPSDTARVLCQQSVVHMEHHAALISAVGYVWSDGHVWIDQKQKTPAPYEAFSTKYEQKENQTSTESIKATSKNQE